MSEPLLAVKSIEVTYSHVILALRGVSLRVRDGEIVALLGANGAGKSTTLKAIASLLPAERGAVTRGEITFQGVPTARLSPADLVRRGVVQVLEGRHCFRQLTVEENLRTGAFARRAPRRSVAAGLERVYAYFPRLEEKRGTRAGYTSGGEQQMLAIGRALMADSVLVLLDEPSMGLAPMIVEEILRAHRRSQPEGRRFLSDRRAERHGRPAIRPLGGHPGKRSDRPGRLRRRTGRRDDVKAHYLGIERVDNHQLPRRAAPAAAPLLAGIRRARLQAGATVPRQGRRSPVRPRPQFGKIGDLAADGLFQDLLVAGETTPSSALARADSRPRRRAPAAPPPLLQVVLDWKRCLLRPP